MSGGRFLVSLTEVLRYESIISLKTILKNELKIEEVTSSEELDDEQISKFISEARIEDHDHVVSSNDTAEVMTYIAGYILYSLLKKVSCDECIGKLKQDPVTNNYVQSLNQGLSPPPSALNHYTYRAFAILDTYEYQIRSLKVPWKILGHSLLNEVSPNWDNHYICPAHSSIYRSMINYTISNIYFSNLARSISETKRKKQIDTKRKDELKQFKARQLSIDRIHHD